MKIGILTFHCAHNYGAVLQCYALQEYLKGLGHEVIVVNYKPEYFNYGLFVWYKWISFNPVKLIRKIQFQIQTFLIQKKRYNGFEQFIKKYIDPKQLDLTKEQEDIKCFIFGSDQIWRQNGGKFDPIFWGDFQAARNKKLISYAASMGKDYLSESENKQIKEWLKNFEKIMVREVSLRKVIMPLTAKEVNVVVDPTLLLSQTDWDKIAILSQYTKPYILIYQVIEHSSTLRIAKEVAKQLGADIVEIASRVVHRNVDHRIIFDSSPNEFIGWIAGAKMVITTSFHGTAFSIIYRKPFISIKQNKPSDLRIKSILDSCGLLERFIDCSEEQLSPILFNEPNPNLEINKISKKYLATL